MGPLYKWPKLHGYLDDKLTTCIGELYLISPPENWWLGATESRAPDVGGSTESAERLVFLMFPTAWVAQPKPPASWNTYRNAGWLERSLQGWKTWDFCIPSFHHKKRATVGHQCVPDHGNTIFFPPIERSRNRERWKPTAKAPDNWWLPGR